MSEIASVLGVPSVFTYKGKDYQVIACTFEVEALFERRLQARALRVVQSFEKELSPAELKASLDGWRRDSASGVYTFGSPESLQYLFSKEGMCYMAFLRLKKLNPSVDQKMADEIYADKEAWEQLSLKMAEADEFPNSKATTPLPAAAE